MVIVYTVLDKLGKRCELSCPGVMQMKRSNQLCIKILRIASNKSKKKSQLPFSASLLNTCGVSFKEYKYHLELHEKSYL